MKSFPKRYAIYLAVIAILAADYQLGGPLTKRAKSPPPAHLGPLAARTYGMPLPESTLEAAIHHHRTQRGLPTDPPPSKGLRIRTTDALLANAIIHTWVKDEGTYFPGTNPTQREDAWLEEKLAPSLKIPIEALQTFRKANPEIPESAARQHLVNSQRKSATRALQRQILINTAENTER